MLPAAGYGSTSNSCAIIRVHYSTEHDTAYAYEGYFYWKDWSGYLNHSGGGALAEFRKTGCLVMKTEGNGYLKKILTNLELVVQWRHLKDAGNSGVFLWAMPASIKKLEAGQGRLPGGIEVQVLDLGYAEYYKKRYNMPPDWFTSHGDVFSSGGARIDPFPPVGPKGRRSFPTKNLTKGVGQWNHYYVRAINGEVRLWVNGEEVSGGTNCKPATGYLCLESEGAPIEFKGLSIRELP